jgi:peptidoglycan/xylan/chitin deacetylase (PgdA/CDA1 family)
LTKALDPASVIQMSTTRTVTVFFRFDDFSETSPVAVEEGLVNVLRKNRVAATFAVIPSVTDGRYHDPADRGMSPLGPAKIHFLKQAVSDGAVDVALHGWNHRSRSAQPPHSEFLGLGPKDQADRIRQGRALLVEALGLETRVFVPPWNRYDENTLEALRDQSFACLSANRYGACTATPLRFVPTTADIREVREAVAAARKSGDVNPIVGVLLHPYDFTMSGDARGTVSFEALDADLRWLGEQPDVRVVSIDALSRENPSLDAVRYQANQPLPFEALFPPYVQSTELTPFFRSTASARHVKRTRALATLATYVATLISAALIAQWLRPAVEPQHPGLVTACRWLAALSLAGLMARSALRRELYFRTLFIVAILAGLFLGLA